MTSMIGDFRDTGKEVRSQRKDSFYLNILIMGTPEEKYELITRGLQEVLDSIKAILAEGRRPKIY